MNDVVLTCETVLPRTSMPLLSPWRQPRPTPWAHRASFGGTKFVEKTGNRSWRTARKNNHDQKCVACLCLSSLVVHEYFSGDLTCFKGIKEAMILQSNGISTAINIKSFTKQQSYSPSHHQPCPIQFNTQCIKVIGSKQSRFNERSTIWQQRLNYGTQKTNENNEGAVKTSSFNNLDDMLHFLPY